VSFDDVPFIAAARRPPRGVVAYIGLTPRDLHRSATRGARTIWRRGVDAWLRYGRVRFILASLRPVMVSISQEKSRIGDVINFRAIFFPNR
jgi:hypothetical protein